MTNRNSGYQGAGIDRGKNSVGHRDRSADSPRPKIESMTFGELVSCLSTLTQRLTERLSGVTHGDVGLSTIECRAAIIVMDVLGKRLSRGLGLGPSHPNRADPRDFWPMVKADDDCEKRRLALEALRAWVWSDYMRVRVTHKDLVELVSKEELALFDCATDLFPDPPWQTEAEFREQEQGDETG